jgi:hypothetical protein
MHPSRWWGGGLLLVPVDPREQVVEVGGRDLYLCGPDI